MEMFGDHLERDATELTRTKIFNCITLLLILSDCGTVPIKEMYSMKYIYDTPSSHTASFFQNKAGFFILRKTERDVTEHRNVTRRNRAKVTFINQP